MTRWEEEARLVRHEMDWTVSWIRKRSADWNFRAIQSKKPHLEAYALRQSWMWSKFADQAERLFSWAKSKPKAERKRDPPPFHLEPVIVSNSL